MRRLLGLAVLAAGMSASVSAQPPRAGWADAPLSAGAWVYGAPTGGRPSRALYGPPGAPVIFQMVCTDGAMALTRAGASGGSLTIRTSSTARTLPATRDRDGLTARIPANDALLDAIAFSRGRFAVETQGAAGLVIPTWSEIGRVIEDCRRGSAR